MNRPLLGAALLLVAAVVWGFAFIPQKHSVSELLPLQATALRFLLAAPLAVAVAVALRRLAQPGVATKHALALGALLFVVYVLQTAALVYAPVARVSLITGLYAVFVPLFAPLLGHARPTALHWAGAVVAFVGLGALVGGGAVTAPDTPGASAGSALNIGDLLVLLHAIVSAFQILLVGKLAKRADPFALNALQLTGLTIVALPAALVVEGVPTLATLDARAWLSFGFLAVFSTVVAFTCQIVGQKHASPPTAAVIMLLETPVAVLFALALLDERMNGLQWAGAAVLLAGVITSLRAEVLAARSRAAPAS